VTLDLAVPSSIERPAELMKGLFETHLNVANLERSMEFYGNLLGLQLGTRDDTRRLAIYWIGGRGHSFLGLWEKPQNEIFRQHFAFEVDVARLHDAILALSHQRIQVRNFFDEPTDVPSVFAWMPAASVYFDDPDGHLLEFLAMLPGPPRPEIGIVSLPEWHRLDGVRRNGQGVEHEPAPPRFVSSQ
jgi:catechol 2,3-dioxygenase-like lactoylglutathione lyase family enzyme